MNICLARRPDQDRQIWMSVLNPLGTIVEWKTPVVGGTGSIKPKIFFLFEEALNFGKLFFHATMYDKNSVIVCEYCHFSFLLFGQWLRLLGLAKKIYLVSFLVHSFFHHPLMLKLLGFLLSQKVGMMAFSASDRDFFRKAGPRIDMRFFPYLFPMVQFRKTAIAGTDEGTYVFSGGCTNRDFDFVLRCAQKLPACKFKIALTRFIPLNEPVPSNTVVFRDVDLSDFMSLLSGCRIHLLSLKRDGGTSGQIVAVRGMQLGRPTVYPDFEPVSCYFGHGLTGVMYKLGDVDSAVAALNDLLENSGRAAALGRAARQAWERGFNPKRFYETISSHMKDFFYEPH